MSDHRQAHHVLYLGRNYGVAEAISDLVRADPEVIAALVADGPPRPYVAAVTSQKAALRFIGAGNTVMLLIETANNLESRLRFCTLLRARLPAAPIIAVGQAQPQAGPTAFAFDGVIKTPLDTQQAASVLRCARARAESATLLRGDVALNVAARRVTTPRGDHSLTPKQCALLNLLMTKANFVVKRADIMQAIWETSYMADTRTLDVHIRWLREHIEPDPSNPIYLITVRGVGYKFQTTDGAE
jgi:DNA-binding response OmpR family regulator